MAASATLNVKYLYAFPSALETVDNKPQLRLATSGGADQFPHFFRGRMNYPRRTADMLLLCSLVSRTRFYDPTEIRERILAAADPVVTSGGERLRFEAFSVCAGAYCRLDLNPKAIDGDWMGRGTTNVDFNPPMRAALAGVLNSETVGLNVGADGVELERSSGSTVEKKVKLPVRWLKGFVEVQLYQSRMKPTIEVPAAELRRLLATVPQHQSWQKGSTAYVVPAGKGIRLSQRETAQSVCIGAPGRLKILEDVLRHAQTVRIYAGPDGVSGWELVSPECSFHFILSPEANRGFSGEGQALTHLASSGTEDVLAKLRAQLQWQAKIDEEALGKSIGSDRDSVLSSLSVLGTRGLVGYDLSEGKYFHRELPFDMELVEELQPRLQKARKLVEEKAIRIASKKGENVDAYVKGEGAEHRVLVTESGAKCTCPWYSKHPGERGPCSHILAVDLMTNEAEGA
ncbi:MAG: SWIM zinc finger domain-containing protein [Candidatus Obscuribacterales bacterium]|nr:SWIM zinc finger domain-containing protein [Candidatus Obscuribacterales bacterium]